MTSALVVISPSLTLLPPSFTFKELCNYIGPTWMSQANLTIISAKSLLPCKVTHSQISGIMMWTSLGSSYSACPKFLKLLMIRPKLALYISKGREKGFLFLCPLNGPRPNVDSISKKTL